MAQAETKRRFRVVTALIEQGGRYLITKRCTPKAVTGLWEFPGGAVEPGETDETTLQRALHESLGIGVAVDRLKAYRTYWYVGYSVEVSLYESSIHPGYVPRPLQVADFRWVTAEELAAYPFVPVEQPSTDLLMGMGRGRPSSPQHGQAA